ARDASLRTHRPILLDAPHDQALKVVNGVPEVTVPPMRGLRTQRFAYFEHGSGEIELYNMIEDPDQLHNVHEFPAYKNIESAMHATLWRYARCAGPTCRDEAGVPQQPAAAPSRFNPPPPSPAPKARAP